MIGAKVQVELGKMLPAGVLHRSYSAWVSHVVVIVKKDGSIRITVNYKRLNDCTVVPVLPAPMIEGLPGQLRGAVVVWVSYLSFSPNNEGRGQHPDHRRMYARFAVRAPPDADGDLWQSGLIPANLERTHVYINGILCFSTTENQHVHDFRKFLARLTRITLEAVAEEGHVGAKSVKFLDRIISSKGLKPDTGKVRAIVTILMPTLVMEMWSVLGALSYHRRFLPGMSAKTKLLKGLLKKGMAFKPTETHGLVVRKLLHTLMAPDVLAFPDSGTAISGARVFRLNTDASTDGFGVIAQKQTDGVIRPICFVGQTTSQNEKKRQ